MLRVHGMFVMVEVARAGVMHVRGARAGVMCSTGAGYDMV